MSRYCWLLALLSLVPLLGSTTRPSDAFASGSVWLGTETGDGRRPNTKQAGSRPAKFVVKDLDGEKFTGTCSVGSDALTLQGKLNAHGDIIAQAIRIDHGGDWDPNILNIVWNGHVDTQQLTLSYVNSRNLSRTINFTLDTAEAGSGKRKKK